MNTIAVNRTQLFSKGAIVFLLSISMPISLIAFASTTEEKIQIAEKFFSAPNAQWVQMDQSFLKHYTVLHLIQADYPHRPSVAIDGKDKPTMLSGGVLKMGEEDILKPYNQLVKSEGLQIDAKNIESYARFFATVHILAYENYRLIDQDTLEQALETPGQSEEAKKLIVQIKSHNVPISITPGDRQFDVVFYIWQTDGGEGGGWIDESRYKIHSDATVELIDSKVYDPNDRQPILYQGDVVTE